MNQASLLSSVTPGATSQRRIAHRTRGHQHGPIRRLVSPSDIGQMIKPFVFLDQINIETTTAPRFGWHPHSGIATLTLLLEGGFSYEDSTGATGTMAKGGVEWMQAGGGVWHKGGSIGRRIQGYQLWVALPPHMENDPARSLYLEAASFKSHGPARVILGEYGGVVSPIPAPSPMNYLNVHLKAGEIWRYDPPQGHEVAWVAVTEGTVFAPDAIEATELVVFAKDQASITFEAKVDTAFVLGSASQHPYPLELGNYSVHTTPSALRQGEEGIQKIAAELQRSGKL